jgi:hypothetical protein
MLPAQLTAASFSAYSPQAREAAASELELLRKLPLAFLPLLLRELISFDSKFPAERQELNHQFTYLHTLSPAELTKTMAPFEGLRMSPELERVDWVNSPADFSEQLSAHLWATHQIDTFRKAAVDYVGQVNASRKPELLPFPRLSVVIAGQGVTATKFPLFRKLRAQGIYFTKINPAKGREAIFDLLARRATSHPAPFAHWYVDGGVPEQVACPELACLSYAGVEPIRTSLLDSMESIMRSGAGPEALRTRLARMRPADLGIQSTGLAALLDQFKISILTEGSGTQVYSTTFVQWSAREILRRAQPMTLVARYAPRLQEQTIQQTIAGGHPKPVMDPEGALRDADMGAYYTWINQQRLPGAEKAGFLVWFEDHAEAVAIGPSMKAATENKSAASIAEILGRLEA